MKSDLSNENLVAAFVLEHADAQPVELQVKLFGALSSIVTDETIARRLFAAAQHGRDLISEVRQLSLDIQGAATNPAGNGQPEGGR